MSLPPAPDQPEPEAASGSVEPTDASSPTPPASYPPVPTGAPWQAASGQPHPTEPYPGQAHPTEPYPGQQHPTEPYPGQEYPRQPYQGQPYQGEPYPGQPYRAQPPADQGYPPPGYPGYPGSGGYPGYTASVYGSPYAPPPEPGSSSGLSIAALVVGIVALILAWVPFLGVLVGLAAVILGIVALVRGRRRGFAIAGLVTGAIGLLVAAVLTIGSVFLVANVESTAGAPTESGAPPEAESEPDDSPSAAEEPEPEETLPGDDGSIGSFATLDDDQFEALVADPGASYGENVILYGEVQQFDSVTGDCQLGITVHNSQQSRWSGYEEWALAYAYSSEEPDTTCPEFDGVAELSHLKLWATVLGVTTVEFDDDSVDDVLTLDIHQVEQLPALPQ